MEKDIGIIKKNADTDIYIRLDDFGGKIGLTIREFTNSPTYKGFTKSGTRIPLESIEEFKKIIATIPSNISSETKSDSEKKEPSQNSDEDVYL